MITKTPDDKLVHAIISAQLALNLNEDLKHTVPQLYRHTLKNRTQNYLDELIKNEKFFDEFFNKEESSLNDVYNVYEKFLKVVALIPIWEMDNFVKVIKAYLLDAKAFERTVNRVTKKQQV